MCEELLFDTLEGKIHPQALLSWIGNHKSEHNISAKFHYKCGQGDFILYFLNYIHDIQARVGSNSNEILQKPPKPSPAFESGEGSFEENSLMHSPAAVKCNAAESYTSPISPLYSRQNLITPRHRQTHSTPKVTPTLCLGDFIVSRCKQSTKKKAQRSLNENAFVHCGDYSSDTRRITPVTVTETSTFQRNNNSFNFENGEEEMLESVNGQRPSLMEDRIRIMSRSSSGDAYSAPKTVIVNKKKEIVPSVKLVTFKQKLDVLVLIYNFMFDHNFILNLASELHFIISVLLSKECEQYDEMSLNTNYSLGVMPIDEPMTVNTSLLGTLHNRVYFASKVLECQMNTLRMIDWAMLRLLQENKRLRQFCSPSFISRLSEIDGLSIEKSAAEILALPQSTVCFISDTDNRDNFPNDSSFHAFRKQRDLFYEVLRVWENSRLQDNWSFPVALGGKIRALLGMHSDPANLVHLARLFKAQLLMNTCGKIEEDSPNGESQLSLLASIPNVDAEKLLRLKSRIVSKESDSSINSRPTFTGYQEFYHDFILVAVNHVFNKHLNDVLISEIVELNNSKFSCLDFDDADGAIDASIRSSYTICIKSLRVLAKFLGLLDSLPYKNDQSQMSQNVVSCQVSVRNETQPSFNLKAILQSSIKSKNLILVVPWVVTYLAMLDYVAIRLPYFEEILYVLFELYYANGKADRAASDLNYKQNVFLVRLCLGWLFELPHFPEGMYFAWLSRRLGASDDPAPKTRKSVAKRAGLDEFRVVDHAVLNACCPYLLEIRRMLSSNLSSSNDSGVTIKHITPTTAAESPTDLSNRRVQLQLEEAFFNGQPVSVRKTVDFISERIASACVKHICAEIVPVNKKGSVTVLRERLESYNVADIEHENELAKIKLAVNANASSFASSSLKELRTQIDVEVESMIKARVPVAIEALFALDMLRQTKDVCASIASRTSMERVQQWVNSHVNTAIYKKDFDAEIKQIFARHSKNSKSKPVFALPMFGRDVSHNPAALSGVEVIENIRGCSWKLLEDASSVTTQTVSTLLDTVYQSVEERCDVNDCVVALVNKMLVDLSLLLIAHRPEIIADCAVFTKLSAIWRKGSCCGVDDPFRTFVCPRNVLLLSQSSNARLSWNCLQQFVANLAEEGLLGPDVSQCHIDVFKQRSFGDLTQTNCTS